ncbi:hypothetical protein BH23CHL2_BH23CHL2_16880 [soil metagenome]
MTSAEISSADSGSPDLLRRAWLTVAIGLGLFLALAVGVLLAVNWVVEHATVPRNANATVISGSEALWRESPDHEWTIFNGSIRIDEGDELSTDLGTVVWLTMFDGSTLEITERSRVTFRRLRQSRFSDSTQQIVVDLHHGTIYGALAPVIDREYSELEVVTDDARLLVRGSRRNQSDTSTAFVVESQDVDIAGVTPFRAAAFRGSIEIDTPNTSVRLVGPEQYSIERNGHGMVTNRILSEIVANGSFTDGLAGWETIYSAEAREPLENVGVVQTQEHPDHPETPVLHIHREDSLIWARTGIRQEIHRTLRLPAELTLSFDVLVEHQGEAVNGRETVPLAIEINYSDILGQERSWTTVYAVRDRDGVLAADSFARVTPGEWINVFVDLHNLEPIPKVLETLVVYASGGGYDSFVANVSLTTSEGSSVP